ncbi:hypothetical protein BDQ17DRAFT_1428602 [Cyathus striatus]|nr:hypothetical protein BDQ17DRAFT_1428602 [Cyathus striatus]
MNRDSSFPCSPLSLHGNIMQPDASHPEDGLEPYSDYHTNHGRTNSDSALASVEITGRKMWKTLRERKSEAVWPPKLESALLEALKKYRPTSSRDPKQLQRFPKRNRFISDYVFQATGQRRTPKQVGSRLQQIRDTCSEEHILKLLTRPDLLPPPDEPLPAASFYEEGTSSHLLPPLINETPSPSYTASVSPSSASYPLPTLSPAVAELGLDPEPTMQFDDMSFYSATPPLPPPSPFVEPANVCIEFVTAMSSSPSDTMPLNSTTRHLKIVAPNPLWNFVPTVSFTSSTQLVVDECRAVARVFIGDSEIHHEESEIAVLGNREDKWLYGSKLVPSYWVELCKTTGQDLSDCRILQVIENHSSSSEGSIKPLFSIIYSFKHHPPPKPPASNSFPFPRYQERHNCRHYFHPLLSIHHTLILFLATVKPGIRPLGTCLTCAIFIRGILILRARYPPSGSLSIRKFLSQPKVQKGRSITCRGITVKRIILLETLCYVIFLDMKKGRVIRQMLLRNMKISTSNLMGISVIWHDIGWKTGSIISLGPRKHYTI